jgi:hypothetical protein
MGDITNIIREREAVMQFSKEMLQCGKLVGWASGNPESKTMDKLTAQKQLSEKLEGVENLLKEYEKIASNRNKSLVIQTVHDFISLCNPLPQSREEYGNYLLSLKRFESQLAREARQLLAKMKKLKSQNE